MRKLIAAVLLLAAPPAFAGEVLVLASGATRIDPAPRLARQAVEIQNLGPNPIYCALRTSTGLVVNKGRKIIYGEAWAVMAGPSSPIYCIAATADQVTTAATIVTEAP